MANDVIFYCLVLGSRSYNDYEDIKKRMDFMLSNQKNVIIVSDGEKGIGLLSKRYAIENGYKYQEFKAKWDEYRNKAGYIRNSELVSFLAKQNKKGCIIFSGPTSNIINDLIRSLKKHNIDVKIIKI